MNSKKHQSEEGETLYGNHERNFIEREGISNGNGLCTLQDGLGKRTLTRAFAGSITEPPAQHSDTVEYNPKEDWTNGTNTKEIESRLRATKNKLDYTEPKTHQHGGERRGAGRKPNERNRSK